MAVFFVNFLKRNAKALQLYNKYFSYLIYAILCYPDESIQQLIYQELWNIMYIKGRASWPGWDLQAGRPPVPRRVRLIPACVRLIRPHKPLESGESGYTPGVR